jgi:hypothetical protein
MKTILITLVLAIFASGISFAQTNAVKDTSEVKKDKNAPVITFETTVHDYGTIPYNGDGTCEFKFKNTGKTPLILQNCQASCGCTVPEWPKEPIQKKKTGVIKVKYATTRVGAFTKTITVTSNADNSPVIITIKGTVNKQEESPDNTPIKDKPLPSTDENKTK